MEKEKPNYVGVDIGLEWIDAAWYDQEKLHHTKLPNTKVLKN
jgi:predicted NBD/HSP70 family sugar kinase